MGGTELILVTDEIDGSLAYADNAFAANGNGNNFNSTLWTRNEEIAAAGSGLFDLDFVKGTSLSVWERGRELTIVAEARLQAYNACVQTNPSCSWLAVGQCVLRSLPSLSKLTCEHRILFYVRSRRSLHYFA